MNETLMLLLAGIAGAGLGAMFFGGLWWTVGHCVLSRRPALWFTVSLIARVSATVAGFYLVGGGQWERLLACLLGFVIARLIVTRLARAPTSLVRPQPEPRHAP